MVAHCWFPFVVCGDGISFAVPGAGLADLQQLGDGKDLPAARAGSAVADTPGEQVAAWAAALAGEPVTAAGALAARRRNARRLP